MKPGQLIHKDLLAKDLQQRLKHQYGPDEVNSEKLRIKHDLEKYLNLLPYKAKN